MTVGKKNGVVVQRTQTGDDTVAACRHLVGGLSSRGRGIKDSPSGFGLADLLGGDSLILAVVPLGEIVGDLGAIEEPGQLTGALCAGTGTAEDELEVPVGEFFLKRGSLSLALERQGNVGEGSVLAVLAPLGFTVADEDNLGA